MGVLDYIVRDRADQTCSEQHAETDLYCASQHTARVQYPLPITVGIIATGVGVFLLTGFIGYFNRTIGVIEGGKLVAWHDIWANVLYLKEPWMLYLWLSGLMVLVQVSILRDAKYLRRLIATLVITVASIAVVGYVYLFGTGQLLNRLLSLLYQPGTFFIINFGLILAFVVDSVRRWLGYGATELNPQRNRELMSADPNQSMRLKRAKMGELISGDLIAGMLLCVVLSIVFRDGFLRGLLALTGGTEFACGSGPLGTGITLSTTMPGHGQPPFACPIPADVKSPYQDPLFIQALIPIIHQPIPILQAHYISLVDTFLAGLCFVPGILVLANTAFIRGLDPLARHAQGNASLPATARSFTGQEVEAEDVAANVGIAILTALREALERYILPYARRAILSLRNVLWPVLILVGSFSFALCGLYTQHYLHHYDPTYNCNPNYVAEVRMTDPNFVCHAPDVHSYLGLALVTGAVGLLCTVVSAALLLVSGRVVSNTLRFMGRIGFVLLLTFWMFSFALFGFNWFLLETGIVPDSLVLPSPQRDAACGVATWQLMLSPPNEVCSQPFGLGWLSSISFAALVVFVLILAFRLRNWRVSSGALARPRAANDPGASTIAPVPGTSR